MEENGSVGSQIFWEVLGSSPGVLVLNGADLILFILAFVFVVVGSIRLRRNEHAAGARYILTALASFVFGLVIYSGYLLLIEDDGNPVIEAFFGLYMSACAAIGGYGFLRLCGSFSA